VGGSFQVPLPLAGTPVEEPPAAPGVEGAGPHGASPAGEGSAGPEGAR
jgi:hypothetical protein